MIISDIISIPEPSMFPVFQNVPGHFLLIFHTIFVMMVVIIESGDGSFDSF